VNIFCFFIEGSERLRGRHAPLESIDDMYLKHQHDAHVLDYLMDRLHWKRLPLVWRILLAAFHWWQARR
jgi:hypothetical protein